MEGNKRRNDTDKASGEVSGGADPLYGEEKEKENIIKNSIIANKYYTNAR